MKSLKMGMARISLIEHVSRLHRVIWMSRGDKSSVLTRSGDLLDRYKISEIPNFCNYLRANGSAIKDFSIRARLGVIISISKYTNFNECTEFYVSALIHEPDSPL
jgi:hypothetical protein